MRRSQAPYCSLLLTTPLLLAASALTACTVDEAYDSEAEAHVPTAEPEPPLPAWMNVEAFDPGGEGPFDDFSELRPAPQATPPRPDDGRDYLLANGPDGATWIPYFERDGWLWAAQDMGLGPVDLLEERSAAVDAVGLRWPYALVSYTFEEGMGISQKIAVEDALAKLSAASPLRFVEDPNPTKKITFVCWENKFGASTGIGMQVDGQTIKIPCAPDGCGQDEECDIGDWSVTHRTVIHEMLHAVGFWHEQNRVGAGAFVEYHPECKDPDSDDANFLPVNGLMTTGPYDLDSMMHYRGTSQCKTKEGTNDCECPTLTYVEGLLAGEAVNPPYTSCPSNGALDCYMTGFDQQGIYRAYGAFWFSSTHDYDYMGWATVAGDFNGDGQDDLVSTAPFKAGTGRAFSYMGIYGNDSNTWGSGEPGLVPWRELSPHAVSDDVSAYPYFGTSAAVGDFNDDGYDDLAIGAPNEGGTGAVYLWKGSALGLVPRERIEATFGAGGLPVAGADYGHAVAFADVDADGKDELVVGTPDDMADFGQPSCGGVYVYDLNDVSSFKMRWSPAGAACHDGAQVGFSLARGRAIRDVGRELIIGAPGSYGNSGRVYVNRRSGSALAVQQSLSQATKQSCDGGLVFGPSPVESGDRFGVAVAADVRTPADWVIAVGSPGENAGTGQVDVFHRPFDQCWARENAITQAGIGADEAGDVFGTALALGDVNGDGTTDLLVGAPGEAVGSTTAGWVYAFGGYDGGFGAMYGFGQSTGPWTNGNGERYGQSIAIGHFDRSAADIVVGAPGNHVGYASYGGSFFLWRTKNAALTPTPWRGYSIDTQSPDAP